MMRLDVATVLLQWAVGGLFFLWVTTRRREVGIGYGWLLRATYAVLAAGSVAAGALLGSVPVRDVAGVGVVLASGWALAVSVTRRRAGVAGERERQDRRAARVAAMTEAGSTSQAPPPAVLIPGSGVDTPDPGIRSKGATEFPPALDLVAPAIGVVGLVAAALDAGGHPALALARTLVGAAFLGAVTDAMLLGHWYLVQPGLARGPLLEQVRLLTILWPFEVGALLVPTGMPAVLSGAIDDGYNGILGWFWLACALGTLVLCVVTRAALRERYYSAVMAATGLLYLAIVTAFGTDLVARAALAP
ncbi:MAG: hypothetical protein KY447_09720 [Actinobacteria bacterium]|nr:hypothetical protein [Actinomycetota bacterium]MBW3643179.1 hypothetical protein [Actinomycetota bacterium]